MAKLIRTNVVEEANALIENLHAAIKDSDDDVLRERFYNAITWLREITESDCEADDADENGVYVYGSEEIACDLSMLKEARLAFNGKRNAATNNSAMRSYYMRK